MALEDLITLMVLLWCIFFVIALSHYITSLYRTIGLKKNNNRSVSHIVYYSIIFRVSKIH